MKLPIKLLLAIPHLGGGGAERVIAQLAQHLDPQHFLIHLALITPDAPGAEPPPVSVTVHCFDLRRVRSAWLPLLRLIRAERPEVILCSMAHLNFLLLLLKPLLPRGTRILIRQNTTASAAATGWLTRLAYAHLYPRADRIICQSQAMADDLVAHFSLAPERLTVLANPIALPAAQSPKDQVASVQKPHLLCVGRLSPEKGIDLLLHALASIKPAYPGIRLTVLGAGPEEANLRSLAVHLGVASEVVFAGYADPTQHYPAATLFVLPSRYEGMPNALLEAAAAGLPIVATPASAGITDLLTGAPGCWLAPASTHEALASTLSTALSVLDILDIPQSGQSGPGSGSKSGSQSGPRFEHRFLAPFELTAAIAAYARLIEDTAHSRHIAMLIPTLDQIGGAERQVILLSQELARRGWHITILALSGSGRDVAVELAQAHIAFHSLGMRKAWIDPRGWFRYLAWHRRHRPAILHAHLPHATWFARWSRPLAPVPVLIDTIHTSKTGGLARRFGYRVSHGLTSRVTCVSQSVASRVLASGMAPKVQVMPNGVLLPQPCLRIASASREAAFRWIAVGRLAPVKDYPTLLRAFALLPGAPTLTIAGTGPEEPQLRALATQLNIAARVDFAGFHADIQPLLSSADAFVLASLWEGLPVSVLEASAAGLPVVATDAAGTREALVPGTTGLLVPPGDPAALADAMARIMLLPGAEGLSMGAKGRQFVEENYSLSKVAGQWEELYAQLQYSHRYPARRGVNRAASSAAECAVAPRPGTASRPAIAQQAATPPAPGPLK